jgi:hypothetical protein
MTGVFKMKKIIIAATALLIGLTPILAGASPSGDLKKFRAYFKKMNPGITMQNYANGIYALDENRRAEWENILHMKMASMQVLNSSKNMVLLNVSKMVVKAFAKTTRTGTQNLAKFAPWKVSLWLV